MTYYRSAGDVPRKRHTVARDGEGDRLFEELMGTHGFSGASSLLYHRRSPSALVGIEATADVSALSRANFPLSPLHFLTDDIDVGDDMVTEPRRAARQQGRVVVDSPAVRCRARCSATPSATRSCSCTQGHARFESIFGALDVGPGDYVVIPTSTTHRWIPTGSEALRCFVIAAAGHIGLPAEVPHADRSAARRRAVLRARPARADRAARRRRRRTRPADRRHRADAQRAHRVAPRDASLRRGRLGRRAFIRTRCRSTTSSRSSAACTSHRRCIRPLPDQASSSARSCPARSTSTPTQ